MREEVAAHYRAKGYTIRERVQVRGASGAVHLVEMVAQGPLGNLVVAFEDAGGFEGPELGAVRRIARDIGATPVVAARRFDDNLRRHAVQSGVVLLDEAALHAPPAAPPKDAEEPEYPPWPDAGAAREAREQAPWPTRGQVVQRGTQAVPIDAAADEWTPARQSKSTDPGFWRYPRPGTDADRDAAADAPADAQPTPAGQDAAGRRPSGFAWLSEPAPHHGQATAASGRPTTGTGGRPRDAGAALASVDPRSVRRPGHPGIAGRPAGAGIPARPATRGASAAMAPWTRWAAIGAGFGASAAVVLYALLRLLG